MVEKERRGLVREEGSCSLWLSILQRPKRKPGHRFKTLASTLAVFTGYCITVFWVVLFGLFVLFYWVSGDFVVLQGYFFNYSLILFTVQSLSPSRSTLL